MGDLTTLHAQAKKLVIVIREGLDKLEAAEHGTRFGDPSAMARDLRVKLSDLQKITSEMESMWRLFVIRESASKRDVWKRKVEQVVEEVDVIRRTLDKYGNREQRRQAEQEEREELFARAEQGRVAKREMDEEAAMSGSVQRSKRALGEIFEQGTNILSNMAANRERLKGAHKRALDVLNSIGLGDTLLKLIEKRHKLDLYMTYGGMVMTLLVVIFLMWWFWR